jgi:hypothetical protein
MGPLFTNYSILTKSRICFVPIGLFDIAYPKGTK